MASPNAAKTAGLGLAEASPVIVILTVDAMQQRRDEE